MARILLTAFLADIRNSVAGTTFSKGRYGNYVKSKGVKTKQNTSYQNAWRNTQSYISKSWKLLTEAERTTWVTNAGNFPQIDKFGVTFYLSGFSLYQQLNLNLAIIDGTPVVNCPGAEAVNSPAITEAFVIWLEANQMYFIWFEWTAGTNPSREQQAFYCSEPGSAGQMAVGKTNYFIGAVEAEGELASMTKEFAEFFPNTFPGQKSFFSIKRINEFTGQSGVTATQVVIFPEKTEFLMDSFTMLSSPPSGTFATVLFNNGDVVIPPGFLLRAYGTLGSTGPVVQPPDSAFILRNQFDRGVFMEEEFVQSYGGGGAGSYVWYRMDLLEALDGGIVTQKLYYQLALT